MKKQIITLVSLLMIGTNIIAVKADDNDTNSEGKEEVVYIKLNNNGDVNSIDVVNIFDGGDIVDYGNYSSVKNLTGNETITLDNDKVTYSSDSKTYYQGTLKDNNIPWDINITYYLDGKKIDSNQLAGSSGKLKINIKITQSNNDTNDYYNNYALQASLSFDTDLCKNIKADNATIANVGQDKQISYTILPGKGLDTSISMDVTDFEMDAIEINGMSLSLDVELDEDELMDKVRDVMDATKELNDGVSELVDHNNELLDGSSDLTSGLNDLHSGVKELDDGIDTLQDGIKTMQSGINSLNNNSSSLVNGSSDFKAALAKLQASVDSIELTTDNLTALVNGSAQVKAGLNTAYQGSVALQGGISGYKAGLSQQGLKIDDITSKNSAAIEELNAQLTSLNTTSNELSSAIEAAKAAGVDYSELESQYNLVNAQVSSYTNLVNLLTYNNTGYGAVDSYMATLAGDSYAGSLVTGLNTLNTNYSAIDDGINAINDNLSNMAGLLAALKDGVNQLNESYANLDSGIKSYTNGVSQINDGFAKLVDGVSSLSSGSKELLDGSNDAYNGATDLYDGLVEYCDGVNEVYDGTSEFKDETDSIDTKIQDEIDEVLDSLTGNGEALSFTSDKNENVDMVQFVMKTDPIEIQEVEQIVYEVNTNQSFWDKIINLFK